MSIHTAQPVATPAPLFPLFADLRDRAVVVVGGGVVASRKITALLEAQADVTVVAATLAPELAALAAAGRVHYRAGPFVPELLDGVWLVIAATGDVAVDRAVATAGHARHVLVNVVDDTLASSFHVPARVRRGRLQVAVSTAGAAPVLARRIRAKLETELDSSLAEATETLARERSRICRRFPKLTRRRRFFEDLLDSAWLAELRAGDPNAQWTFEQALQSGVPETERGHVALVGAGPGDPDLLTLKALRALQRADVIVYDRLVGAGILELARRDAERINVGKCVGENHAATQARIHALLLAHARAGRYVVRLQGGDPLIFGRAGEELEFLRANGVSYEVVPGITAALASAAAAGIALTDRRHTHGVTLLTARGQQRQGWTAIAATQQTLAIYMGVGELEALTSELIQHGRQASTPCVLVERASLPGQRKLAGTLAEIAILARAQHVRAPALLIVGEVAAQAARGVRTERCPDAIASVATAA